MKEFTNKYGKSFRVGDQGEILSNFSKNLNPTQVRIVSFTPSGMYMRAEDERGITYLFSTSNSNLKGSHMGNSYISFRGFEDVNAAAAKPAQTADIRNHFDKQYDLIPEEFEIIGWGYPEMDIDHEGNVCAIPVVDYNGYCLSDDVTDEQDEWLKEICGQFSTNCNHCGKRMKYFAIIAHIETRELHIIGTQCAASMKNYTQQEVDAMHKKSLKARQRVDRVQKERKAKADAQAFIEGVDGLREALLTDHYIINDISFKLNQYGSISDAQVALIFKIVQQIADRKKEMEERAAAGAARKHFGQVGDRIRSHSIKCVFSKAFEGNFGVWYLAKFEDADGNQFTYRGSAMYDGGEELVASFTIKEHGEFRGEKQTSISRIHVHECI
jgi:hypothetical protein